MRQPACRRVSGRHYGEEVMKLTNRLLALAALAALMATGCSESVPAERPRLLSAEAAAESAAFIPARWEVGCADAKEAVRID